MSMEGESVWVRFGGGVLHCVFDLGGENVSEGMLIILVFGKLYSDEEDCW